MALKKVEEEPYGLYVWYTDDNRKVVNEDGDVMNIPSRKGDLKNIRLLEQAARYWGIEGGRPVFLSGHRRVTDDEYDYQQERMRAGLIPDPLDFRALEEEQRYGRSH